MLHYHWYAPDTRADQLPAAVRYWLYLPGSLTQALRKRSASFSLQVLAEGAMTLDAPIAAFTQQTDPLSCWSRQVALCHGDTPWVLAHTLVTRASLDNGLHPLTRLNNRPLGELLFATPGVYKDQQEITRTELGWGPRARYWLHGYPVLVAEFFMDALLRDKHQRFSALP
jgi:chorismate--pyruvate lyase